MKTVTVAPNHDRVLSALRSEQSFLIAGHEDPDGDCVGSQIALDSLLRRWGKTVHVVNPNPPQPLFQFLRGFENLGTELPGEPVDAAIILDAGDVRRTGRIQSYTRRVGTLINIDHHPQNRDWADIDLIDESASSVGEIVYDLYKHAQEPLTPPVAEALYVSVLTDTGSFRYSNTGARTLEVAADLIRQGDFQPSEVYGHIYEQESIQALRLRGLIFANLQRDDGIVWAEVPREFMERTETIDADLQGVLSDIRRLQDIEVILLFREREDGSIKVHFRSKDRVDLLNIVRNLGGGGHRHAAGATLAGPLGTARERVLAEVRAELHSLSREAS